MPLFDAYVMVDWSARGVPSAARPCADALWVGEGSHDLPQRETYWRTRTACCDHLRERLVDHVRAGRRVLVGFDFAFGYPAGFVEALELGEADPPWLRLWRELAALVQDDVANANNRFAVASA